MWQQGRTGAHVRVQNIHRQVGAEPESAICAGNSEQLQADADTPLWRVPQRGIV